MVHQDSEFTVIPICTKSVVCYLNHWVFMRVALSDIMPNIIMVFNDHTNKSVSLNFADAVLTTDSQPGRGVNISGCWKPDAC